MGFLQKFLDFSNGILWGYLLIYLLLGAGVYFTIRTGFVQIRLFTRGIQEMLSGTKHGRPGDITPFQAFATGMASRVGTGNIAGVAIAISLGGPGAVFWMWMTALLGMASSVIESTLAQVFKVRDEGGLFRGGPAYYIEMGLGKRWLGTLFALSLLLAFGFAFNAIQANSIAAIVKSTYGIEPWIVGLFLVLLSAPAIFGGVRSIGAIAEYLVPFMALFYFALTLYVLARNLSEIPAVFELILKSAFGFGPAASGFAGYAISQAMMMGVKRGLFSNEAGMGSAPNAAATANTTHPATQGFLQMFGVFIDTIIVCTCTALLILLSGAFVPGDKIGGVELTQKALSAEVGVWGNHFLAIAIFFFAFSSVLGNYAYAEGNVAFIKGKRGVLTVFRLLVIGMVFFGAVAEVPLVWSLGDFSQALMAIINLASILLLSKIAFKVIRDYERQLRAGVKTPTFDRRKLPELESKLPRDVW